MKLSTKTRYATRAMLDLATQTGKGPVIIKDISKRQGISCLYLEQLLSRLNNAGLVTSMRGPKGGFMLTKLPSETKISEILQIMEGSTALVDCVDNTALCPHSKLCVSRKVWIDMKKAMDEVLKSTTLQDLVDKEKQSRPKRNSPPKVRHGK